MMAEQQQSKSWLSRLARDVRGNTLAITAAALVPLCGMLGGAVDGARMYLTRARLQHACDAGTLAGRKAMGGGQWSQNSGAPNATARRFFAANFATGAFGTSGLTYNFSENAGKVSGTASATVPMTLMKVLAVPDQTITVTCDAELRLPNTDIMFVLDTTGSMAEKAVSTDTQTKIEGLRTAVKCFYEIVARLDTTANCATGAPSGGTGSQVQVRFGFVPYASNVNVGRLLPPSYFADTWDYQTRSYLNNSGWTSFIAYNYTYPSRSGNCTANTNTATRQWRVTKNWYNNYGWLCFHEYSDFGARWQYKLQNVNVSVLKNGSGFNGSFTLQIGNSASGSTTPTNKTITWDGCIEERKTVRATNYDPIPSAANDLDIDMVPTSDPNTQWGFALPGLIYARNVLTTWDELNNNEANTADNYYNNVPYSCPTAARKLQAWPSASGFESYVDSLTPSGNTYHDIGILWGARLMSPDGIFASENRLTPLGGEIERHMIFMTDGDTNTSSTDYAAYGMPWFDRRQTDQNSPPSNTDLNNQVNARFAALCKAVKNKNITLWVISFGSGSNAATEQRLSDCATPNRYFTARDSASLQTTFASIANQISQLRLTQ
ncbi:MAG: hypothetical protein A4S16_09740 [Proteobacteria bacterium SG_bin6]|nr:MAG: hypothetical protein A4S16_09740 [Proteobacteria bacterium SG_bin6]